MLLASITKQKGRQEMLAAYEEQALFWQIYPEVLFKNSKGSEDSCDKNILN